MRRLRGLLLASVAWALLLGSPARAITTISLSSACGGTGFAGTAENLNVTIGFEACPTAQGYHALIRDYSGRVLAELFYDTPTEQTRYFIDGIEMKAGKEENYHEVPKYLGGNPKAPTVRIDAAYHQEITNAFREAWKYGQSPPSPAKLKQILDDVYTRCPLPSGD